MPLHKAYGEVRCKRADVVCNQSGSVRVPEIGGYGAGRAKA